MGGCVLDIRRERQCNPVAADEVGALVAVVRPILTAILNSLKNEAVVAWGRDNVPLYMLPRIYRRGDGDCGICFEYAVHDALNRGEPKVVERVADAMRLCRLPGSAPPTSILFGAEKNGVLHLIESAKATLTDNSRLLRGGAGQPIKIGKHLETVTEAFRNPDARRALPASINGLWKADLIIGRPDADRWVAASVKINVAQLEAAQGIRIGIVPSSLRHGDAIREERGLIVCPIPHDGAFMQKFYEAWRIVRAFLDADAKMPPAAALPRPEERYVADILTQRRQFPVRDVVEAIRSFAQPELLQEDRDVVPKTSVRSRSIWTRLFFRAPLTPSEEAAFVPPPEVAQTILTPIPRHL